MKMIVLLGALLLAGCDRGTSSGEPDADARLSEGAVALIATAPDGTKLWGVRSGVRVVYFATGSTQTQHAESCGKNCTRTVIDAVPTASQREVPVQ